MECGAQPVKWLRPFHFGAYPGRFTCQMPQLRAEAKVTQQRYGSMSQAASELTLL